MTMVAGMVRLTMIMVAVIFLQRYQTDVCILAFCQWYLGTFGAF